jgi:single-stranded-DNA-specific exonuclease
MIRLSLGEIDMRYPAHGSASPTWIYPKENDDWKKQVIKEFKIHPITAQIFVSREFNTMEEIHSYLYDQLPNLPDPYLLTDMKKAAARVVKSIQDREPILIYGDNDVDGMTATALLTDILRSLGGKVYFFISGRDIQRGNLIIEAIDYAKSKKCGLMITVDCGVSAASEIEQVIQENIDVIVTDHHEPTDKIPLCTATLNPKLIGSEYPNRDITGVGVAFKLAHAVTVEMIATGQLSSQEPRLKGYLDLVALGTISDMGALLEENRIFVRYGLKEMEDTQRIGLKELFLVSGVDPSNISTADIASKIAPRLNSLGRIADPRKGVELLLLSDPVKAEALAKELDLNNIERQKIERTMSEEVDKYIEEHPEMLNNRAIILASTSWHPGVIPIIATRICKQYNRPTIIIAIENGVGKGSARSIREFPLLPAFRLNSPILMNFGGHDFAAGMTIRVENLEEFKQKFIETANNALQDEDVVSKLRIDSYANFDDMTFEFMESLRLFEPFGNENPQPIFCCEVEQVWPPKVIGENHLKLYLQQNGRMLEGIAFGMASLAPSLRRKNLKLLVAFTPQINTFFQNQESIQLLIKDLKIIEP